MKQFLLWSAFALVQFCACATLPENKGEKTVVDEPTPPAEERWGLKVVSVRLTANALMLDLRYQVIDSEKAFPLMGPKIRPYLIDQATGTKLLVPNMPKVGSMKQRITSPDDEIADKTYFMLFANSQRLVRSGSLVTLIMGDFKVENLVVQ
jgi:hypothetical protein